MSVRPKSLYQGISFFPYLPPTTKTNDNSYNIIQTVSFIAGQ